MQIGRMGIVIVSLFFGMISCNSRQSLPIEEKFQLINKKGKNMTEPTSQQISGQCHCGAIRYRSSGPIFRQGVCKCRACQRATGTLGSPNVGVKPDTFEIIQGVPSEYKADSNEGCEVGTWYFCCQCGAPLYWKVPDDHEVAIFVRSLDDTSLFKEE
jgi:hypothetical protein